MAATVTQRKSILSNGAPDAGGSASKKSDAKSSSTSNPPNSNSATVPPVEEPYVYQHQNPYFLGIGFIVSAIVVICCLYHFYQLRQSSQREMRIFKEQQDILEVQSRQYQLNTATKEKWDLYAEHRGNISKVLLEYVSRCESKHPSLLTLGAGNMNDLALNQFLLAQDAPPSSTDTTLSFSSLALVDIDGKAMEIGLERHFRLHGLDRQLQARIKLYVADITNSYETFNTWKREAIRHAAFKDATHSKPGQTLVQPFPYEAMLQNWKKVALQFNPSEFHRMKGLPQLDADGQLIQYDMVSSICIMSQILDMYMSVVPESHPDFLSGALAIRENHLALMINLLKPKGWGIIITDIVASTTIPKLVNITHAELPGLATELINTSNFFTGCNPAAIRAKLMTEAHFQREIRSESVEVLTPWKWTMGGETNKQFLVYAIVFQKK